MLVRKHKLWIYMAHSYTFVANRRQGVNSMALEGALLMFQSVITEHMLQIMFMSTSCLLKLVSCECEGIPLIGSQYCFMCWLGAIRARFLSLTRSKLRLCSANHRAGYFSNLACDWLGIVWAYSKQETENGPRHYQSRCCPRCMPPHGVTRPQWVNSNEDYIITWNISMNEQCVIKWMRLV